MATTAHMPSGGGSEKDDTPLPRLREEIEIVSGWPTHYGAPSWVLLDPVRNAFFRIEDRIFQILSAWPMGTRNAVKQAASARFAAPVTDAELERVVAFLFNNGLTEQPPENGFRHYAAQDARSRKSLTHRLVHNYLFFKIPLFRPTRLLNATMPLVAPLLSRQFALLVALLGVVALYLVSRQWDVFLTQFTGFLNWQGAALFLASLVVVKIVHELAHAYMARHFGADVSTIGVAFLLLFPILYTDTTGAWKLTSRRQRLLIDAAGIFAELTLAVFATLAWVFLPDGALRAAAFSIATVSWVMSLLINLNPFMRFDGYYILSDLIGFENLQARGFALGRWRLRETLFGLNRNRPERLPTGLHRTVLVYAYGTWIYRFFLFLGIALLIYAFFIKPIAIVLFIIEIAVFLALPIFRELKEWWSMRKEIMTRTRGRLTLAAAACVLLLAFLPLSSRIAVPAVLSAGEQTVIFPSEAAYVEAVYVSVGQNVREGDVLLRLSSQKLMSESRLAAGRVALLETRLSRIGSDASDNELRRVVERELAAEKRALEGLAARLAELEVRAPHDGRVVDPARDLHAGRHVARDEPLFVLRGKAEAEAFGLIAEVDIARVSPAARGRFFPDDLSADPVPVTLMMTSPSRAGRLRHKSLAEAFGGDIPASPDAEGQLEVHGTFYPATLKPTEPIPVPGHEVRGVIHLDAEPRSFAAGLAARVASVLIRESGF